MIDLLPITIPIILLAIIIHKFRMWNQNRNEKLAYLTNIKSELLHDIHNLKDLENQPKKKSNQQTKAELIATLQWLQQLGVIDHNEYNTIYLKALPFTKG